MGTFGPGPFDGDDAYDVLDEFQRSPTIQTIEEILNFVLTPGYDGVEWERALAAAEIVAIMQGHPAPSRSCRHSEVIELVGKQRLAAPWGLVKSAILVCQKAIAVSELQERIREFSEPEFYDQWILSVTALRQRLQLPSNIR